jgi:hypothetical protein
VAELLEEVDLDFSFQPTDRETGHTKDFDSHIMGRFKCSNPKCKKKGWSSKQIAIWIRLYSGSTYNARVFHQRCKSCTWLSSPDLDAESYAERIAYRLKKWANVPVAAPPRREKKGPPHRSELCEGCKNGHCAQGELEKGMKSLSLGWH